MSLLSRSCGGRTFFIFKQAPRGRKYALENCACHCKAIRLEEEWEPYNEVGGCEHHHHCRDLVEDIIHLIESELMRAGKSKRDNSRQSENSKWQSIVES